MGEIPTFYTPDLADFAAKFPINSRVDPETNMLVLTDSYELAEGYSAILGRSKTKIGELRWANAVFADNKRGLVLYYDHDFWGDPIDKDFVDDPYAPYRGTIVFFSSSGPNQVKYGTFYYDASGLLRTIKGGSFAHTSFETNAPSAAFQRTEGGLWRVYRFKEFDQPDILHLLESGTKMQPQQDLMKNGEPYILDEIATTITEFSGRLHFHQQTLPGHKRKNIEVPANIDIPTWRQIFDAIDGSWIQILKRYPSSIQVKT